MCKFYNQPLDMVDSAVRRLKHKNRRWRMLRAAAPVIDKSKTIIVFSGGGYMSCFLFGVARYIKEHYQGSSENLYFAGVSAGALAATGLALDCDIQSLFEETLKCYPRFPTMKDIRGSAESINPGDVTWRKATNRLYIGATRFPTMAPENIHTFESQEDGTRALEATCQFPLLIGMLPIKIAGKYYYDGAMFNDYPSIPEGMEDYRRIYVNWVNSADIYPGIDIPMLWMLCPPSVEGMWQLENLGYLRAKEYFRKMCV